MLYETHTHTHTHTIYSYMTMSKDLRGNVEVTRHHKRRRTLIYVGMSTPQTEAGSELHMWAWI